MSKITNVLAVVLIATSVAPSAVFGATNVPNNFCTKLSARDADLDRAFAAKQAKLEDAQADQLAKIEATRNGEDARIAARETATDANRAKRMDVFNARAITQAQKDAVAAFGNAINAAETVRRASVDAAFGTQRSAVDALVATRQAAVRDIVASFGLALDAAVAKATASCATSAKPGDVQKVFQSDLSAARTKLASDMKALPKIGMQMAALRATRIQAVVAAREVFKTVAEAARTELAKFISVK